MATYILDNGEVRASFSDTSRKAETELLKILQEQEPERKWTSIQKLPKGKHVCKYCGGIAEGTYKDLLCEECRECFGHALYSEL